MGECNKDMRGGRTHGSKAGAELLFRRGCSGLGGTRVRRTGTLAVTKCAIVLLSAIDV
jgi:hypothetical protein